jgi:hypothetical protein
VASDLPSLREVLRDGENAVSFLRMILLHWRQVFSVLCAIPAMQTQLVERAYSDAQAYTWNNRAKKIVTAIERTIHAS